MHGPMLQAPLSHAAKLLYAPASELFRWCTSQHVLLALLAHQLAQRVPRGAEFQGPVPRPVRRVCVDNLAHGAAVADPRQWTRHPGYRQS